MWSPEGVGSPVWVESPMWVESPQGAGSGGSGGSWTFLPLQVLKCDTEMKQRTTKL